MSSLECFFARVLYKDTLINSFEIIMKYELLGNSGLEVSIVSLGTNNFGAQVAEKDSISIINKAIDQGINSIDTANQYTSGRSEQIIGKAIEGRRDDIVLATKGGWSNSQLPNKDGLSRKALIWQIKRSLKNLKTDYIDLYYLHRFDHKTPLDETLKTLDFLVREGKIRYVACSNFTALEIAKSREICEVNNLEKLIAVQSPYNLLNRKIEDSLLPYCDLENTGVLTYSPLMGGLLTGKYRRDKSPPKESRGGYSKRYLERINKLEKYELLAKIENIAQEVGVPMHKLATAWILKNSSITGCILGASNIEQVEDNSNIVEIPDKIFEKLNKTTENL